MSGLNHRMNSGEKLTFGSKWAAVAKCPPDTTLRDNNELVELGIFAAGKSVHHRSTIHHHHLPGNEITFGRAQVHQGPGQV